MSVPTTLTDRQQRVYATLQAGGALTPTEVADDTGISVARVRDILRALQAFGLVDLAGVSLASNSRTWTVTT